MFHNRGDVYLVLYPFDDQDKEKLRPGIIFDTRNGSSIVIKVTTHEERTNEDIPIKHWRDAGLDKPSYARCSMYVPLNHDKIKQYLGTLSDEDLLDVLSKMYDSL